MKNIKILAISAVMLLPYVAFAAPKNLTDITSVKELSNLALDIVYYLMQTLFALISLGIVYNTYKYINALREGDKDAERYRKILIGAIIGLAVAFSVWSIVNLLSSTLGWSDAGIPALSAPDVQQ